MPFIPLEHSFLAVHDMHVSISKAIRAYQICLSPLQTKSGWEYPVHNFPLPQACILLSFPPPPGKSKGLKMGEETKGGKKRKKESLGKI